jgi:hypothetical protein
MTNYRYFINPEIVLKMMMLYPETHFSEAMIRMYADSDETIDPLNVFLDDETKETIDAIRTVLNNASNIYIRDSNATLCDMVDSFILATIDQSELDNYMEQFIKHAFNIEYTIDDIYNHIKYLQLILDEFNDFKTGHRLLHSKVVFIYEQANKIFFDYCYTNVDKINSWRKQSPKPLLHTN